MEEAQVRDFQVIDQVVAKNKIGDPRFNTPVWPGYNSVILAQVREEEKVKELLFKLKEFNRTAYNESELLTVCTWTLDDYFFGESMHRND